MICVYSADCSNFSNNGLGVVSPESCTVTETLNGEYELTLVHPIEDNGKWTRLTEGNILRAPVPAAMTPQVGLVTQQYQTTTYDILVYKVSTRSDPLRLRSGRGTNYKILGKYKKNSEVIVLDQTCNASWFEVTCPDGKHGYMSSQYLTYVRTDTGYRQDNVGFQNETIEPRQLRDQPFRNYRVVPELTKIAVYARHIFYDLLDNMIRSLTPAGNAVGAVDEVHLEGNGRKITACGELFPRGGAHLLIALRDAFRLVLIVRFLRLGNRKMIPFHMRVRANVGAVHVIAANIDVDTLFAREATIAALNAADITGNEYLRHMVAGKADASDVNTLTERLSQAELKITDSAIVSTVTSSTAYRQAQEQIYSDMDALLGFRVEIVAGTAFLTENVRSTTLTARVWHGNEDVTDNIPASRAAERGRYGGRGVERRASRTQERARVHGGCVTSGFL